MNVKTIFLEEKRQTRVRVAKNKMKNAIRNKIQPFDADLLLVIINNNRYTKGKKINKKTDFDAFKKSLFLKMSSI